MTTRLVADVGGTNTRIALFDPLRTEFRALRNYTNRDFSQLEDIIAQWLEHLSEPEPRVCCIAVAAPPSADYVAMTNIDWSFSCRELASRFGFDQLRRLNDFEANAYALPYLTDRDKELLFPGKDEPNGRLATLGPGTGLGGAFLGWHAGLPHSFACEPGHMGLTPANQLELELFTLLLAQHSNIYAELLVSGPGLVRLQRALGEIRGEPAAALDPAEISHKAITGEDDLCVSALEIFCALLGSVCGDFLLANRLLWWPLSGRGHCPRDEQLCARQYLQATYDREGRDGRNPRRNTGIYHHQQPARSAGSCPRSALKPGLLSITGKYHRNAISPTGRTRRACSGYSSDYRKKAIFPKYLKILDGKASNLVLHFLQLRWFQRYLCSRSKFHQVHRYVNHK